MLPSSRYWPLPELDRVEIEYTVSDLWANTGVDPDEEHVQRISGEITGVVYDDDGSSRLVPLGRVELARIDLDRLDEEGESLLELLDATSSEWVNGYGIVDLDDTGLRDGIGYLLVADRVVLRREARGRGLGLHALARALRTWATDDTLVVLTAASCEHELGDSTREARREASRKLARYWAELGMKRIPGSTHPEPVMYARGDWRNFADALRKYSAWESPLTACVAR
jgi:GNAT superfamily N-acetyltransferase